MKFKKARKIFRILFPLKISDEQFFERDLANNQKIKKIIKQDSKYEITLINGNKLLIRNANHSDYDVFKQIFNLEEYKLVLSLLNNNPKFLNNEKIFIDAGANVGFTVLYFSFFFNFDKIFCIEPSIENISILNSNIKDLSNFHSIKVYQRALTNNRNVTFSLNNNFRDKKDWSISTTEDALGEIKGITIDEIIEINNLKEITFLKIDIEGAERFIFKKSNNLNFLSIVKILAIEVHDEFNIRQNIYEILIDKNFLIFETGELTIALNRKFISNE